MKYAVCGTRKGNIYKGKFDFVIFLKYKIKYKGYSIKKTKTTSAKHKEYRFFSDCKYKNKINAQWIDISLIPSTPTQLPKSLNNY